MSEPPFRVKHSHLQSFIFALLIVWAGCTMTQVYVAEAPEGAPEPAPPSDSIRSYRVFLIGDAGVASAASESVLRLLKTQLRDTGEDGAVVFLGDNVYCCGLPDSGSASRAAAEARLLAQLQAVEDFPGRIVFIPGNRDWDDGRPGGQEARARQEAFVEAYLDRGNTFLPDDGFPGPIPVEMTDDITLIVLDTFWWFANDRRLGDTGEYELREPSDLLVEFEDVLHKHRDRDLLIVGHHPLYSNSRHGGRFPWREHFTPLPIIGSLDIFYRRFVGRKQDLASEPYQLLRRELLRLFDGREDLIYAGAHDHNLQYFRIEERRRVQHFLTSGAGSRLAYVAGGHGAAFTARAQGFLILNYYDDRSIWLEAWTPDSTGTSGRRLYRRQLKAPEPDLREEAPPTNAPPHPPSYSRRSVVQAVNSDYKRNSSLWRLLFGTNNRDLWATPVEAPVLNLDRDAGGLTPLKMGGQSQSITMRLQGGDGHVYMLRSIDKVAARGWPPPLRRTIARTMAKDQISMLHPFGAFIVPPLADAAGVFHTNPRLVYVPDDPRLGSERGKLVGQVVLFEKRPDEDMSDVPSMGGASNVISSSNMLDEINDDNDHRVGAHAFARARLLDMLIADWDRTTDNFRWAAFEPYELDSTLTGETRTKGKVYLPVPRDRDAAFAKVDGLIPSLYIRFIERTWQDFDKSFGYLRSLNAKGFPLDRRLTASLTRADWISLADSMRAALTDDVIERAVRTWPPSIFAEAGAETIAILKARRDKLTDVAEAYYEMLADVVDVVGSEKHERFEVTRMSDAATEVVVYKTTKEGEVRSVIFERHLFHDETRELRLYGQGGNDQFILNGDVRQGLPIIIVGGPGDDLLADSSRVHGSRHHTHFYDTPTGTEVIANSETRLTLRNDPVVNRYVLDGYRPNMTGRSAQLAFNRDEGLYAGLAFNWTRRGFRKDPYAARHQIGVAYAVGTNAFNVRYEGHFVDLTNRWDMDLSLGFFNPNTTRNFYGLGNETENTEAEAHFYQARFTRAEIKPRFEHRLFRGVSITLGPTFEYTDVHEDSDRFIGQPQAGISDNTFDQMYFGGLEASIGFSTLTYPVNPKQGFRFRAGFDVNADVLQHLAAFATFSAETALYLSPSLEPQVTVATRLGGAHTLGEFPFFAANTLGSEDNLRGYRSTRFAGRSSLYQNVELRIELLDFSGYLGYGELGLLAFLDNGRVWTDGERSRAWHQGYGTGFWVHLFDAFTLNSALGVSKEDHSVSVGLGFLF